MRIKLENISKTFDKKTKVLENLNVEIESGSLTTLLGLSGCGKTTLLRIIAGLEKSDTGNIFFNEEKVFSVEEKIDKSPLERNISFVFQDFALWPNMSVLQNVMFGIENREKKGSIKERFSKYHQRKEERRKRAMECLSMVKMDSFADRLPSELSGGQKQRVAIARAIAIDPNVILFDEPLSALDALLREDMRIEIRNLVKQLNMTALFVTHDQEEAMSISDSIIIMNHGQIVEQGTPKEIYWNPKTKFVANFIGKASFVNENQFLRPEDLHFEYQDGMRNVNVTIVESQCRGGVFSYKGKDVDGHEFCFSTGTIYSLKDEVPLFYSEGDLRSVR
jgi:iron(III) transport system ATP-binding protein